MARDWLDLASNIEAYYPRARGGASGDETLRRQLVTYADNAMKEIERDRRWSLSYGTATQVTTPGTAVYALPAGLLTIDTLYRLDPSGTAIPIESYDATEMRIAWGEGALSAPGPPINFSILGSNIQLFPVPDNSGPTAGNYTLIFVGYQSLLPIVETAASAIVANPAIAVPSTVFLTSRGVATAGTYLSIKSAGPAQFTAEPDNLLTAWTAFPTPVAVTITTLPLAGTSQTQAFFNSSNWLIQDWPKVLEFAVLKEVACYLKDDFKTWEGRYQDEMERMAGFDIDRQTTLMMLATAQAGAKINQLRRLDVVMGVEVRGGVL